MRPDYKREFEKERQRLAQLWDAYEAQGAEIEKMERQVWQLEHMLHEKEGEIGAMRTLLEKRVGGDLSRDVHMAKADEEMKDAEERIQLLERNYKDLEGSFSKATKLSQELDEELKQAKSKIAERDRIISQLKLMLESKDKQLELLRPR